jgi:hypothetical protein
MDNDPDRYRRAEVGDFGYLEEIGLRGDDLREAIAEWRIDHADETSDSE